ncbi:GlcG/HbpS family heme-binding protein [Segnochrobactrum spirostomi]|uniref:Heme-binding protein n=1 Tax=Segnochrobactrum spirostomi TaxID=2608987 RepID=A0A6A7Y3T4_9HYPH|nr:heme-binding protein [Segnochrobactrum spirostomi]MQT13375.1 heme-binding protein [Segnochrobactrum spirostomi]
MSDLTLVDAQSIVNAALAKGGELGLKPIAVAVLDAGGQLKAFARQDAPAILRADIAIGKAYGALAVGQGTRWLNRTALERPHFLVGLSGVSDGKIIPVIGGVLIKTESGRVIGAVGVSGDTSENDEVCGIAGIEAAGFVADPGA